MSEDLSPIALSRFDGPDALARALAAVVAEAVRSRLARAPTAALAVSGGRTPTRFFQMLSGAPLDWARVTITLVDERWVPESSDRSNAALVRANLLQGPAAQARFLPLFNTADSPEAGLAALEQAAAALPLPFAAVVLGMGADGHTASFFPGAANLGEVMDPNTARLLGTVSAPDADEPRMTFTLPPLLAADALFLHIEGTHKWDVLEAARGRGAEEAFPIRAILRRTRQPLDVLWCP